MKKQLLFAISFLTIITMACEEFNPIVGDSFETVRPPAITAFNPRSAECGTEITLYGDNFGPSISDNFVTFDALGFPAFSGRITEVTEVHAGRLLVRIPMKLNPGEYTVSIEVNAQAGSSIQAFQITEGF